MFWDILLIFIFQIFYEMLPHPWKYIDNSDPTLVCVEKKKKWDMLWFWHMLITSIEFPCKIQFIIYVISEPIQWWKIIDLSSDLYFLMEIL